MKTQKSVWLGVDPGLRHTGIAISYEGKLSQPLITLHHQNAQELLVKLGNVFHIHRPRLVIIGQPHTGVIFEYSQKLKDSLNFNHKGIEIYLHPEDLSSKEAIDKMLQSGKAQKKRKQMYHSSAAALILQDYINSVTIIDR